MVVKLPTLVGHVRYQQKALSLIARYIRRVSSAIILRTGLGIVVKKRLQQRWRNRMPEPLRSECITLENRRRAKFDERSHWLRLGMDWASRRGCRGKVAEQESVETWDHAEIGSPVGTAAQTQLQVALKDLCDLGERMMDF